MDSIGSFIIIMGLILLLFCWFFWMAIFFIGGVICSVLIIIAIVNGEWGYIFFFIPIVPLLYLTFPYFLISIQVLGNILTAS